MTRKQTADQRHSNEEIERNGPNAQIDVKQNREPANKRMNARVRKRKHQDSARRKKHAHCTHTSCKNVKQKIDWYSGRISNERNKQPPP